MIDAQRARELLDAATPGPWKLGNHPSMVLGPNMSYQRGEFLAAITTTKLSPRSGGGVIEESRGDVHLIAAAPELAETVVALEAKLNATRQALSDLYHAALAVIADLRTDDDYEARYWADVMGPARVALDDRGTP